MPQRSPIATDIARYEMGRRVRVFEAEFQRRLNEPAARRAVLGPLQAAVGGFFSGRFDRVAEQIDNAHAALTGNFDPAARWAAGLALVPEKRLADVGAGRIPARLIAFTAAADAPVPSGVVLEIDGRRSPVVSLPHNLAIPVGATPTTVRVLAGNKTLAVWTSPVSGVKDLTKRLDALRRHPAGTTTRDRTIAETVTLLDTALSGKCPENDPDYGMLLERAERAARPGGRVADTAGDWRLVLGVGSGAPARLLIPDGPREPRPLVVALHGAGGSENLYFEAYGAGRIVELCRQRNWLLVAPRTGSANPAEIADAVNALVPVKSDRVFLTGHSMGAMAGAMGVQAAPGRFAAVALLGGGGRVNKPDAWKDLPFLVGAGDSDFGKAGAKALEASAKAAGARTRWIEYPAIEHLGVVQAAMDDVFQWFDSIAKGNPIR